MTGELSPIDKAKFVAAKKSVEFVEDGMRVGLGTGSTAAWMVRCLGELVREDGLKIRGVPTSTRTAALAREVGIEVISLDEARWLDLTIDGADEFDAEFNLIKGGGGALLQEKIVATASDRMIVISDVSKEVDARHMTSWARIGSMVNSSARHQTGHPASISAVVALHRQMQVSSATFLGHCSAASEVITRHAVVVFVHVARTYMPACI